MWKLLARTQTHFLRTLSIGKTDRYRNTECEVVWNNANMKKLKDLENDLSQCNFVHHKSHIDCRGIESRPLERGWNFTN